MRQPNRAFTLVEILIVVLLLAILAAIVVSQVTEGPDEARRINLRENLSKIRMQLALYRQHHNRFPAGAEFTEQMTQFTDANGNCSLSRSEQFRFPPYLEQMPANPITNSKEVRSTPDPHETGPAAAQDGGWWYNEASGLFYPDLTDDHVGPNGERYNSY